MLYDVLCEKMNPRSGRIQPYIVHDDNESSKLFDIAWKGNIHFVVYGWEHFGWYYVAKDKECISEQFHFNKMSDRHFCNMQKMIDEIENGKYRTKKTLSEKIRLVVEQRNLTSCMNNTKWRELVSAINETIYDIPIQYKTLFDEEEPEYFWTISGDEDLNYMNMSSIEWFKIAEEIEKVEFRGRLIESKVTKNNKKEEIIKILQRFFIPFEYDEINKTFIIYGYK